MSLFVAKKLSLCGILPLFTLWHFAMASDAVLVAADSGSSDAAAAGTSEGSACVFGCIVLAVLSCLLMGFA